jgi:hypothetical protein
MEQTYLKWLGSGPGLVSLGLFWPFGVAAAQLLMEQGPIDFKLDWDFLPLLVLLAIGGLPIFVTGLCRMKSFQRAPTIELVMSVIGMALIWLAGLAATVLSVGYRLMIPRC